MRAAKPTLTIRRRFRMNFSGTFQATFELIAQRRSKPETVTRRHVMLGWALAFFIFAIIAAALGFGGIAGASAGIAQILFFVFLALLVLTFVVRALRGRNVV
jgi:uncharacterized membrane protein YtjA (UPF0391 family)